ncbi:MAG: hypothetical protein H8D22_00920, partial [Candidatus Cloacimonetes bacterium]|nr:hypothetical protein [Candidatus Cloacimonadota bacterium]
YEGVFCTQSGNIGSWQSTSLLIELNVLVDDEISFWKKVSCEDDPYSDNYDYIAFFIDGVEQDRWDGEIDWSEENYSVASGNHIFKWKYLKDGYVSSGSDCAWIDYIIFPPNDELFGVEDEQGHQIEFGLFQNYPNPFCASTTISFLATDLHRLSPLDSEHLTGQAQIKIYNVKGQLIKTLTAIPLENFSLTGQMTNDKCLMTNIVWDGKDEDDKPVSSGIYFYNLRIDWKSIDTKKCLLLK